MMAPLPAIIGTSYYDTTRTMVFLIYTGKALNTIEETCRNCTKCMKSSRQLLISGGTLLLKNVLNYEYMWIPGGYAWMPSQANRLRWLK